MKLYKFGTKPPFGLPDSEDGSYGDALFTGLLSARFNPPKISFTDGCCYCYGIIGCIGFEGSSKFSMSRISATLFTAADSDVLGAELFF